MFHHTRDVPAEWQRELESIVPRSEQVPWLKIVWQPGLIYEPVQRWEIYEMIPALQHVPLEIREALEGPNPREVGEWMPDNRIPQHLGGKRWITSSFVSQLQWRLFHETHCYSQRFWIIQGTRGGHKWKLSPAEHNFAQRLRGASRLALGAVGMADDDGEIDTPLPGDLPYAEWDRRVREKMIEHDKLRRWKQARPWDARQANKTDAGLFVKRERKAEEEEFAQAMLKYLETQVSDVVSDIPRRLLPARSDLAPTGLVDEEALDAQFVDETATSMEKD